MKGKRTNKYPSYRKWYVNTLRYTLRLYIPLVLIFWIVYTLETNGRTRGFISTTNLIFYTKIRKLTISILNPPNTLFEIIWIYLNKATNRIQNLIPSSGDDGALSDLLPRQNSIRSLFTIWGKITMEKIWEFLVRSWHFI